MDSQHSEQPIVLLVDDQPAQLRLMKSVLSREDVTFLTAADGQEALEVANSFAPDFVFSDILMPKLDGVELCRQLRATCDGFCHITLTSADIGPHRLNECLDAGADIFLPRPYDPLDLLACLRSGKRLQRIHNRLKNIALADPLTGLPTRAHFDVEAQREFERSRRHGARLSCAVLDADFFKNINDIHGHAAGDEVLRELARLLNEAARISDFPCRFGGEEFCILLPETDEDGAKLWADRVRKRIEEARFGFEGKELRVSASIGVAELSEECQGPLDLFVRADKALLLAKQTGRNRVVTHGDVVNSDAGEDIGIPSETDPFWELPAGQVMSLLVATLSRDESLRTAAELFLRFRINAAPVVDDEGNLEGILSEKDIMSRMKRCGVWETTVGKAMNANVVSYETTTPIGAIHDFLCRSGIRRVVIMRDGRPCGIIGRGTVLGAYRNWVHHYSDAGKSGSTSNANTDFESVIDSLVSQVEQLQKEFKEGDANRTSAIIHSVSRVQELGKDLLVAVRAEGLASEAILAD